MQLGLVLYSIRTLINSEDDFLSVCKKLKEMGYDTLHFAGIPFDAEQIKRVMDASGLRTILTHVSEKRILEDTDSLMADHELFGCRRIGLGRMSLDSFESDDAFKSKVARLQASAEKMKANGFEFFYHHHSIEFAHLSNGQIKLDYMIENAPDIKFTCDTYWMQHGGVNILDYLEKLAGRMDCVHLKDYQIKKNKDGNFAPTYAHLGGGNIDFPKVIEKCLACGAKHFIVEQDDATFYPDPMQEVKYSIDYFKKITN